MPVIWLLLFQRYHLHFTVVNSQLRIYSYSNHRFHLIRFVLSLIMQSDVTSESPSQQSDMLLPPDAPSTGDAFVITRVDASILETFVDEFQDGNADVRSTVVATAMAELYMLRPPTSAFNKAEANKVRLHVNDMRRSIH